ncbi:MAG: hypothetical protein ACRDDK_03770 [Cetobacterium sp.]
MKLLNIFNFKTCQKQDIDIKNLKLQRDASLKKKVYKESFEKIKIFKNIKKLGKIAVDDAKIDFANGEKRAFKEFPYENTHNGEFEVLKRFVYKEFYKFCEEGTISFYMTRIEDEEGVSVNGIIINFWF